MVGIRRPDGDVHRPGAEVAEVEILRDVLGRAASFAILRVSAGALAAGFFFRARLRARRGDRKRH